MLRIARQLLAFLTIQYSMTRQSTVRLIDILSKRLDGKVLDILFIPIKYQTIGGKFIHKKFSMSAN